MKQLKTELPPENIGNFVDVDSMDYSAILTANNHSEIYYAGRDIIIKNDSKMLELILIELSEIKRELAVLKEKNS